MPGRSRPARRSRSHSATSLDIAEFELIDRTRPERLVVPLPAAREAPLSQVIEMEPPDDAELER